jgi:hypothetical protein
VNLGLLKAARAALPRVLNRGMLMGERGPCVLGFLWMAAGHHPISLYAGIDTIAHPRLGGPAVDVIASLYGIDREAVAALRRANDDTPAAERSKVIGRMLDELIARGGGP